MLGLKLLAEKLNQHLTANNIFLLFLNYFKLTPVPTRIKWLVPYSFLFYLAAKNCRMLARKKYLFWPPTVKKNCNQLISMCGAVVFAIALLDEMDQCM